MVVPWQLWSLHSTLRLAGVHCVVTVKVIHNLASTAVTQHYSGVGYLWIIRIYLWEGIYLQCSIVSRKRRLITLMSACELLCLSSYILWNNTNGMNGNMAQACLL